MTILNTYYNFTEIFDDKGNISYKKSQIYSLKDNVFMFNNSNEYNNFNIYNYYDNDKYQITLGKNNSINSYISKIKYPLYFNNRNITEIYSNTDADETVLIVKYLDNSTEVIKDAEGKSIEKYQEDTEGKTSGSRKALVADAKLQQNAETTIQIMSSLFNLGNSLVGLFKTLGNTRLFVWTNGNNNPTGLMVLLWD